MFRDEPEAAIEALDKALPAAEAKGMRGRTIELLITKSWALVALRRPREATALLLGCLRIAQDERLLGTELRAIFNLVGYLVADDPQMALKMGLEGVDKAREFGLSLNAANMVSNAASAALLTGDLQHVVSLAEGVADLDAPLSAGVLGYAAGAYSLMGDGARAREAQAAHERTVAATSSAQDLSQLEYVRAIVAFGAGELETARARARASRAAYFGSDGPFAAALAARVSLLLGDLAGAREDRSGLDEYAIFGTWIERCRREVDAGILALEGKLSEAALAFGKVVDEWREADMPLDHAIALLTRARLLGADDSDAAAGREEAARVLDGVGAAGLIDRLESGAPPPARLRTQGAPQNEDAAAARR
jgi:hypothetical protein